MFTLLLLSTIRGWSGGSWCWGMPIYCSYISGGLYFVFEYVAMIIRHCWSDYVPHCFWCIPSDFAPTHVGVIKLNWVVLTRSRGDVDKVSGASSDCSPPGCFEIYKRNVSLSSVFYGVWRKGPAFSSCKACHSCSLVLLLCCH